jgi:glycosyltransferase involved in cell wall biosynthesis/acetyltransferase-like isoleucine patch superfamily enzyme
MPTRRETEMSPRRKENSLRPAIAYVVHSLNFGGAEQLAVRMSLALSDQFHMHVLCLDEPGVWAQKLRDEGITVHCLWRQPGFDLNVARRIAAYGRKNDCRILHAHQFTPWHYTVLSKLFRPGPKIILEEHGRHYPEVDNAKRRWFNRLVGQLLTSRFVAVSRDIKERMVRYEGLNPERIEVIYNGCEPPEKISADERREIRRELGFQDGDFVIGTVGRFDPVKNLPLLIKAVEQVRRRGDDVKAVLVGDGPVMNEIRELIVAQGLEKEILLAGYRDDAQKVVQAFDLFVLASFSEGTSMALLEAMAAGVPCLVTDVGGNPEIVRDGETGWVVPSDDPAAMALAIQEALQDARKRERFARAGRERFQEQFSFTGMLDRYRRIYGDLYEGAGRRRGMKDILKLSVNILGMAVVSPLSLGCWLEKKISNRGGRFFEFSAQCVALVPGLPGVVLRRGFYRTTLKQCSLNCYIGFGSLVTHREAVIEDEVYIGNYNVLGTVHLRRGTFIASRVSIPSGGQIHERTEDGGWTPMVQENLKTIEVGPKVWIGEGALVMADVAQGSLVAAGSVVVKPVAANVAVAGNPAKVIKEYAGEPNEQKP